MTDFAVILPDGQVAAVYPSLDAATVTASRLPAGTQVRQFADGLGDAAEAELRDSLEACRNAGESIRTERGECWAQLADLRARLAAIRASLAGLLISGDGNGEDTLWRAAGERPTALIRERECPPEVWALIVAAMSAGHDA